MPHFNCDTGEGLNNEAELMPFISACNIACGGHAGDEKSMLRVSRLAAEYQVEIGAHPAYPDKEGFGRKSLSIDRQQLIESIRSQVGSLESILFKEGLSLSHIKPHGALYNDLSSDQDLCRSFAKAIQDWKANVKVYLPAHSMSVDWLRELGFAVFSEGFADRNYEDDLSLVPRSKTNAILNDPKEVVEHVKRITTGTIRTVSGRELPFSADTLCVHGDSPQVIETLKALHHAFV